MLFNSFAFALFLPLVFVAYWWVFKGPRTQNLFVAVASFFFYGWWDWRFTILLFISAVSDYGFGLLIDRQEEQAGRKRALLVSLIFNLGILAFFKYFNFFIDSVAELLRLVGMRPSLWSLRVVLPIGISFYTLQSMSYTLEVYRRTLRPVRDPIAYVAFVSFFPHMVAGPIMRAADLLPQFMRPRTFGMDRARDGLRQMLWGFFKKIAVADPCGNIADTVFGLDAGNTAGITLFLGAVCFAFQIYGDFSGYSDIAIGCARLFGISLSRNFAYPYFSRSVGEFWRRWHISLSSWLRDYVYRPLGGARTRWGHVRNVLLTFGLSGLWHGANWTFVGWGLLHGAYYIPGILTGRKERTEHAHLRDLPRILFVFGLVLVAWVFFRAPTVGAALDHLGYMVLHADLRRWELWEWAKVRAWWSVLLMLVVEWNARREQHGLALLPRSVLLRWPIYLALVIIILLNIELFHERAFIYFRF